jgi:hypothetical protein
MKMRGSGTRLTSGLAFFKLARGPGWPSVHWHCQYNKNVVQLRSPSRRVHSQSSEPVASAGGAAPAKLVTPQGAFLRAVAGNPAGLASPFSPETKAVVLTAAERELAEAEAEAAAEAPRAAHPAPLASTLGASAAHGSEEQRLLFRLGAGVAVDAPASPFTPGAKLEVLSKAERELREAEAEAEAAAGHP